MNPARVLVVLGLLASPALAQEPPACAFDWPLRREQAWFEASALPRVETGATLPADQPGAVLALKPVAEVEFPFPPSREPSPGSYAGYVRLPAPVSAGLYQVTISGNGWLDVSQEPDGPRPSVAHTGNRNCPSLRKSLRFQLASKPVVIVISGAGAETIKVAFAPAE